MERADHRRLHRRAPGLGVERKIGGGHRALDIDGVGRPVRPGDLRAPADIPLALGNLGAVGPDLLDRERSHVGQEHDIGEAAWREGADKRGQPHVPRRIDGGALNRDLRREAALDRQPDVMIGRAELQRVRGAAIVGREGDLRPVGQPLVDQELDDLRHRIDAQLDEQAARELVPGLFRRLHLVIGSETRRREGVDRSRIAQARGVALDDAARGEVASIMPQSRL